MTVPRRPTTASGVLTSIAARIGSAGDEAQRALRQIDRDAGGASRRVEHETIERHFRGRADRERGLVAGTATASRHRPLCGSPRSGEPRPTCGQPALVARHRPGDLVEHRCRDTDAALQRQRALRRQLKAAASEAAITAQSGENRRGIDGPPRRHESRLMWREKHIPREGATQPHFDGRQQGTDDPIVAGNRSGRGIGCLDERNDACGRQGRWRRSGNGKAPLPAGRTLCLCILALVASASARADELSDLSTRIMADPGNVSTSLNMASFAEARGKPRWALAAL